MSIRLRSIEGIRVALCAARSVPKSGDTYLSDSDHYALASKFWLDYADETNGLLPTPAPEFAAIVEREESNNVNRLDWDKTFAPQLTENPSLPDTKGTS